MVALIIEDQNSAESTIPSFGIPFRRYRLPFSVPAIDVLTDSSTDNRKTGRNDPFLRGSGKG
jgi:hypothetical protein